MHTLLLLLLHLRQKTLHSKTQFIHFEQWLSFPISISISPFLHYTRYSSRFMSTSIHTFSHLN